MIRESVKSLQHSIALSIIQLFCLLDCMIASLSILISSSERKPQLHCSVNPVTLLISTAIFLNVLSFYHLLCSFLCIPFIYLLINLFIHLFIHLFFYLFIGTHFYSPSFSSSFLSCRSRTAGLHGFFRFLWGRNPDRL